MPTHDPAQRFNQHHSDDLLAIARVLGPAPTATAARADDIDHDGLQLAIDTPSGPAAAHLHFADLLPDVDPTTPVRRKFRALAKKASGIDATSTPTDKTHRQPST